MTFKIIEETPDHHYRTEIPHVVEELGLDVYEYRLYCYYKRVAGDDGECFQSQATIHKRTGISPDKQRSINENLRRPFDKLDGKSLIRFYNTRKENGGKGTNQILIVNIWKENGANARNNIKTKTTIPLTAGTLPADSGYPTRPQRDKEEPIEEEPIKNKNPYGSIGAKAPAHPPESQDDKPNRGPKVERARHVSTTDREHKRLVDDYGEQKVARFYTILSEWKQDTAASKWKKDDNRAIRRWVIDAEREEASKGVSSSDLPKARIERNEWIGWMLWNAKGRLGLDAEKHGEYLSVKVPGWQSWKVFRYDDARFANQIETICNEIGITPHDLRSMNGCKTQYNGL